MFEMCVKNGTLHELPGQRPTSASRPVPCFRHPYLRSADFLMIGLHGGDAQGPLVREGTRPLGHRAGPGSQPTRGTPAAKTRQASPSDSDRLLRLEERVPFLMQASYHGLTS